MSLFLNGEQKCLILEKANVQLVDVEKKILVCEYCKDVPVFFAKNNLLEVKKIAGFPAMLDIRKDIRHPAYRLTAIRYPSFKFAVYPAKSVSSASLPSILRRLQPATSTLWPTRVCILKFCGCLQYRRQISIKSKYTCFF